MRRRVFILVVVLATAVSVRAETVEVLRCDFSKDVGNSAWLELTGDSRIENGVLKTAPVAGWKRSGLNVGPVPVGRRPLVIEYDVHLVKFGRQCQEFASQTPTTHWYMIFVSSDARIRLYTRSGKKWQQRAASQEKCRQGEWYRVRIELARTNISCAISRREDGKPLWRAGPVAMNDIGEETVFALVDESSEADGATEWDNLVVTTGDRELAALWRAKRKALEAERRERERREKQVAALREAGVSLIPMVQEVALGEGRFVPAGKTTVVSAKGAPADAAEIVGNVLAERLSLKLDIGQGGERGAIAVCPPAQKDDELWKRDQAYRLEVAVSQGAFQVIDVDYWKRMIRELAAVKINAIMPYFEGGTFYYEKYPFLGLKGRDGFTIEKGRVLSEYARRHFVEMIPQQESLGHSGSILNHPELKDLRESGGVFCSSKPEVFSFLGDLYDELVEAFPYSRYIHVGGDEFTHGFAKCPLCKARAEKIGPDGLYAEHMMKLRELLAKRNRGMMIWWHERGFTESAADRLAKDIVVFDWHYGNARAYPSLDKLMGLGFTQTWATPAITRYYRKHADDWNETFGNIRGFLRAAAKRNVPGECTCTWVHGIWGGRNLFELNYYGLLFSAECAWNPAAASEEDFRRKFAARWFGLESEGIEEQVLHAIHAPYGDRKEQKFWRDCRVLEPILGGPPSDTAKLIAESPGITDEAKELIAFCDRADEILDDWKAKAKRNVVTIDFLKHDVHMHRAAARRILCIADVQRWWAKAAKSEGKVEAPRKLLDAARRLLDDYAQMERMFERSVKEAGGGLCDGRSMAAGGIRFRMRQGREGIEKLIENLERLSETKTEGRLFE